MSKTKLTEEDIKKIISLYKEDKVGTHKLGELFKVGHKKISQILKDNNVLINKKGGQITIGNSSEIEKSKTNLYSSSDNKKLVVVCKKTKVNFEDSNNLSGCLTRHLLEIYTDISIPTNTYQRKKYEIANGKKWFEEYFDILEVEVDKTIKCGVCGWETCDLDNDTGSLTKHIINEHNLTINEYVECFPNEKHLWLNRFNMVDKLNNVDISVICLECNKPFLGITEKHLILEHDLTINQYKDKWGDDVQIFSNNTLDKLSLQAIEINKTLPNYFTSKPQLEIKDFIEGFGVSVFNNDKKILCGVELDLLIPDKMIAIEYNGLYWHSESIGKDKHYHLNKTELCEKLGYRLIHIFEDEWKNKNEIVKNRLKHILGLNTNMLYARKCKIREITSSEKDVYLNKTHIQGGDNSSVRLGGFFNDELVSVMTFGKPRKALGGDSGDNGNYELIRFASDGVVGIADRLLKYFIRTYKPNKIISYADRRWSNGDLYNKLGFKLINKGKPNYWYMRNYKIREHRFNYRKDVLVTNGFDKDKSETQIMVERGFDRIWDCGSLKYELTI